MSTLQTYIDRLNPFWITLQKTGNSLQKVVSLNPTDDRVSYKSNLCLSIERGEITAAYGFRFFSRIRIKGIKKYPVPDGDYPQPGFLSSSASLAAAELKAVKSPITLCLPKAWVIIKTVDYPVSILENLSEVMASELDRITPFTNDSAYFDFKIIREEAGRVFILVAAVRTSRIDPYLKTLRENGAKVQGVTVDLLGLNTLLRFHRQPKASLLVELEKDRFEGILVLPDTGVEVFAGSFGEGSEQNRYDQLREGLDGLFPFLNVGESQKVDTLFYFKEKNPALKELIKLQSTASVSFLEESDLGIGLLRESGQTAYAAVGGLLEALWTKSWGLNMLLKGAHQKSKIPWVLTLLLILSLAFLVGLYWMTPVETETKKLEYLDQQIALKKAEAKKVDSLKEEINLVSGEIGLISEFKQTKPLTLNIMKELTLVLPKNTWLTRVRIFESQVNIEGYSPSATLLIPKLEGTKLFKKVEFASPTFKDPRQNMDRFQIKMEIKNPL
jgi:Tfp pilus assembly protein PilN